MKYKIFSVFLVCFLTYLISMFTNVDSAPSDFIDSNELLPKFVRNIGINEDEVSHRVKKSELTSESKKNLSDRLNELKIHGLRDEDCHENLQNLNQAAWTTTKDIICRSLIDRFQMQRELMDESVNDNKIPELEKLFENLELMDVINKGCTLNTNSTNLCGDFIDSHNTGYMKCLCSENYDLNNTENNKSKVTLCAEKSHTIDFSFNNVDNTENEKLKEDLKDCQKAFITILGESYDKYLLSFDKNSQKQLEKFADHELNKFLWKKGEFNEQNTLRKRAEANQNTNNVIEESDFEQDLHITTFNPLTSHEIDDNELMSVKNLSAKDNEVYTFGELQTTENPLQWDNITMLNANKTTSATPVSTEETIYNDVTDNVALNTEANTFSNTLNERDKINEYTKNETGDFTSSKTPNISEMEENTTKGEKNNNTWNESFDNVTEATTGINDIKNEQENNELQLTNYSKKIAPEFIALALTGAAGLYQHNH